MRYNPAEKDFEKDVNTKRNDEYYYNEEPEGFYIKDRYIEYDSEDDNSFNVSVAVEDKMGNLLTHKVRIEVNPHTGACTSLTEN